MPSRSRLSAMSKAPRETIDHVALQLLAPRRLLHREPARSPRHRRSSSKVGETVLLHGQFDLAAFLLFEVADQRAALEDRLSQAAGDLVEVRLWAKQCL